MAILVLLAGCALYCLYFGVVARPQWALYAYAFLWMVVRKAGNNVPGFGDVTPNHWDVFPFVQAIAAVPILLAVLRKRPRWPSEYKRARKTIIVFVLVVIASNSLATAGVLFHLYPPIAHGALEEGSLSLFQQRVELLLQLAGAVVWCVGALSFLSRIKHMEVLLGLWLVPGFVLLGQLVWFVMLGLGGNWRAYVLVDSGRFTGLLEGGYDLSALVAVLSAQAAIYFSGTRRWRWPLLMVPGLMIVVLLTYERNLIIAAGASLAAYGWWRARSRRRLVYMAVTAGVTALAILALSQPEIRTAVSGDLSTRARPHPFSGSSLFSRAAFQIRALDIIVAIPTGVGTGAVDRYMGSDVPSPFSVFLPSNRVAEDYYGWIRNGTRLSGAHNIVLQFLVEYGILGFFPLFMYGISLLRNFRRFMETAARSSARLFQAQLWTYCSLTSLVVHYTFDHNPYQYFIWGMVLFFSFALDRAQTATACPRPGAATPGFRPHRPPVP